MLERTKKIALSCSVIVLFGLYALQRQTHSPGQSPPLAGYTAPAAPVPTTISRDRSAQGSSSGSTTDRGTTSGAYQNGTYVGNPADANWGNVEVQAVISNGQISDVQFLQYPNHRNRSRSINEQAMPMLSQEAIQSQQAFVDIVSGATDTSEAFIQSLDSALQQAAR